MKKKASDVNHINERKKQFLSGRIIPDNANNLTRLELNHFLRTLETMFNANVRLKIQRDYEGPIKGTNPSLKNAARYEIVEIKLIRTSHGKTIIVTAKKFSDSERSLPSKMATEGAEE